jgi:hypothetical protein
MENRTMKNVKRYLALLMAVCLLCAAGAAGADMEIPAWESMPLVVVEDGETTVDEAAFEGEWVLNVAFLGTEYVDEQTLAGEYGYNFMPYIIGDGKIRQDVQNENGEFTTEETPYTLEAGQLQGTDDLGVDFVIELLEDGNIVMSLFLPGEGETVKCLSVFLVHPAE